MKNITLSNGQQCMVDDNWFEYLNQFRWFPAGSGYASRKVMKNGVSKAIYMHRQVANTPEGMDTDHINGDKLDNREANLRVVSHHDNLRNYMKLDKRNGSGYRGVTRTPDRKKWRARIGKKIHLGVFDTPEQASKAIEEYHNENG